MTKLSYFTTIVCIICLFFLPTSGFSKVTKMTDQELEQITAQAGFSDMLEIFQINHDDNTGSYYFGGNGAYISMADISYDGSIDLNNAIVSTQIAENNGATVIECVMDGNVVDVSNFSSTIRLGSEIGAGNSLGTLHMGQMIVGVHGTVRITAK